jgi:hypothetical protein
MPISPSNVSHDPYAPLSWDAAVVILALERLKSGEDLDPEERSSIPSVAEQLRLLSEAAGQTGIKKGTAVPAELRSSFFTLVAMEEKTLTLGMPPKFGQAAVQLASIDEHIRTHGTRGLDLEILNSAQSTCTELLEQLNEQTLSEA